MKPIDATWLAEKLLNLEEGLGLSNEYGVNMMAYRERPHEGDCPHVVAPHASTCNRCIAEASLLDATRLIAAIETHQQSK